MKHSKEKTLKCLISSCRFNSFCQGCEGLSTSHFPSDVRCSFYLKNWQQMPKDSRVFLRKLKMREKASDEIIQICPKHFEFYDKASEMAGNLQTEEGFLSGSRSFYEIYRQFPECRGFFKEFLPKVLDFFIDMKVFQENDDETFDIIAVCLKLLSFVVVKDMEMRVLMRENADFVEALLNFVNKIEDTLGNTPRNRTLASKTLFLLTSFNNLQLLTLTHAQALFKFCLNCLDLQDFELSFHLISCIWSLSYTEEIKSELKKIKKSYFFQFFNSQKEHFDIQFKELMMGFLFFVFEEETKMWKQGKIEDGDVALFMEYIEKNAGVHSYRVSALFE